MKFLYSTLAAIVLVSATANAKQITISEKSAVAASKAVGITQASINGKLEHVLTDLKGMSVYTFDLDKKNTSNCKNGCLVEWPPVHVPANVKLQKPFASIKGNDGIAQLTVSGLPLYYYDDDKKVGDAFGNYPNWHSVIVK